MEFNAFEIDRLDPLLQTGYLTIKSMVKKFNMPESPHFLRSE